MGDNKKSVGMGESDICGAHICECFNVGRHSHKNNYLFYQLPTIPQARLLATSRVAQAIQT